MKLLLAILPLVHAGTNKTIAPTPGFERPNPPSPTAVDDDYVVGCTSSKSSKSSGSMGYLIDCIELSGKSSKSNGGYLDGSKSSKAFNDEHYAAKSGKSESGLKTGKASYEEDYDAKSAKSASVHYDEHTSRDDGHDSKADKSFHDTKTGKADEYSIDTPGKTGKSGHASSKAKKLFTKSSKSLNSYGNGEEDVYQRLLRRNVRAQ